MEKEIKILQKLIKDGFKKVDEKFVGVDKRFDGIEKRIDDLAISTARGFEEAGKDRSEIKDNLKKLELKVDNWHDDIAPRLKAVERKVGIDPLKHKKIRN